MCIYDGDQDGFEINKEGYGSNAYCNKFQTTFNEHGMCYTYNNYELSLDKVCKSMAYLFLPAMEQVYKSSQVTPSFVAQGPL